MQCQRTGCEAEATHAPVLVIPPIGGSPTQLGRLRAIVGLQLCRSCSDALGPSELLSDEGKRRISAAVAMQRVRRPDFDRAAVEVIPIAGGEFQAFLRNSKPS